MPTKIYIDEITSELEEWNYDDSDSGIFKLNNNKVTIEDLDSVEMVEFNLNDMKWEEDNGTVTISKKEDSDQNINFEISDDQDGGSYPQGITLADFLRLLNISKSEQGGGKKKKKKSKKRTKKKKSKKRTKKKKSKKRKKKKKSNRSSKVLYGGTKRGSESSYGKSVCKRRSRTDCYGRSVALCVDPYRETCEEYGSF